MKAHRLPLVLVLLLIGCQSHPAEHARYRAERERYWAERGDIRFALENSPRVREGRVASGMRHERVAILADPAPFPNADPQVLDDLRHLQAQGQVRAGRAYLEGGEFDRAFPLLDAARSGPVSDQAREAGWLLAQAQLERPDRTGAERTTRELLERVIREAPEEPPSTWLLDLPIDVAQAYTAERDTSGARRVAAWARPIVEQVARRWPEARVTRRARFQLHRLAVLAGRPDQALADLLAFEANTDDPDERDRAELVRAELLAVEKGDPDAARTLYRDVRARTRNEDLRGLARLRLIDLMIIEGESAAAADSLTHFSRESGASAAFLAAADSRLAELQRQRGDDAAAIQAYRRLVLRFPDTMAALVAPLEVVEIQREQSPGRGGSGARNEEFALKQATDHFRRVLAGHPGDSTLGRLARRNLVHCLRELGDSQQALLEAEQLYHSVGPTHAGMEALLLAARIAAEDLDQSPLAIAYLARIQEEWPGSAEAREAAVHRQSLEAGGDFDP